MNPSIVHDCCAGDVPFDLIRDMANTPTPDDDLTLHICRLASLHPSLVRFRGRNLDAMDTGTKQQLLADMYDALGIPDHVR